MMPRPNTRSKVCSGKVMASASITSKLRPASPREAAVWRALDGPVGDVDAAVALEVLGQLLLEQREPAVGAAVFEYLGVAGRALEQLDLQARAAVDRRVPLAQRLAWIFLAAVALIVKGALAVFAAAIVGRGGVPAVGEHGEPFDRPNGTRGPAACDIGRGVPFSRGAESDC